MTTEAKKSTSITNADATPVAANTIGTGAPGFLQEIGDYSTPSASMAAGSTYQLVRVPTTAKIKSIIFESAAQTAGKFDVGVYYSDSTSDGTPASLAGTAVDQDFFASDIDCASAVTPTEIVNESGTYTIDKRGQPLWQAAGLSADPGGFFDIVATVHTTDITTGTGKFGVSVRYVK
jgi:hypothetical protein